MRDNFVWLGLLFGKLVLVKLAFGYIVRCIKDHRGTGLVLVAWAVLSCSAVAQVVEDEPTLTAEELHTHAHQKNVETLLCAGFGAFLGRVLFASWRR